MGNKRAVAEVVGALLMIALAVTGGVVVYVYSSGLMGSLHGGKVNQPYLERVSLDYYAWDLAHNKLNLTLRNVGSAQVTLADFFIAGKNVTANLANCPGGVIKVNAPPPYCPVTLTYPGLGFNTGVAYNVRVVTKDGAVFDFLCIAGTRS